MTPIIYFIIATLCFLLYNCTILYINKELTVFYICVNIVYACCWPMTVIIYGIVSICCAIIFVAKLKFFDKVVISLKNKSEE